MNNPYRNVGAALAFGTFSLIIFLTALIVSIRLFIDLNFSIEAEKVINTYFVYAFTFYNMLIGLISLFFVGEYNMLLIRVAFDRKSWYNKLKILSYFILIDMLAGSFLTAIVINSHFPIYSDDIFHLTAAITTITILLYLNFICIYLLHPDLWNFKRRREIREMIEEIENNRRETFV